MAKMNKEESARREGMAYALKIAKEKGIEGLEEELRFRNITQLPLAAKRSLCEELVNNIKINVLDTVTILAVITLRDEFAFGKKRIDRFVDRFNLKAECLVGGYTDWKGQIEILREELGMDFVIRREEDFKNV